MTTRVRGWLELVWFSLQFAEMNVMCETVTMSAPEHVWMLNLLSLNAPDTKESAIQWILHVAISVTFRSVYKVGCGESFLQLLT